MGMLGIGTLNTIDDVEVKNCLLTQLPVKVDLHKCGV